ncbi:hypothetical protein TcYC6_0067000 [Trypanosoma cruzi]|nr:hypothetical protein TcYC6_0067000 [Trypanosoma cruzi]
MPGEPLGTYGGNYQAPAALDVMQHVASVCLSDGALYEGPLVDGKPEGRGVCVFPSGVICAGRFSHGHLDGHAEMLLPTGALFSGSFKSSAAHGSGLYVQDGRLTRGRWHEGFMVEQAEDNLGGGARAQLFTRIAFRLCDELQKLTAVTRAPNWQHLYVNSRISEPKVRLCRECSPEKNSMPSNSEKPEYFIVNCSSTRSPSRAIISRSFVDRQASLSDTEESLTAATTQRQTAHAEIQMQEKPATKNALAMGASAYAIFACAAPASNEFFSFSHYVKYCLIFLFPFLSLPQFPFSPIRKARLEMEREFIVSGASLLRKYDPPFLSLHFVTLAMCCSFSAVVIAAAKVNLGAVSDGRLTLAEIVIPCVFWVLQSLFYAAYNSYMRVAHALERFERRLTPRLSAFTAGLVDTKAKVCIYTWDEKGRGMVTNKHYRYRWLACSIVVGIVMGLAAPLTRVGFGHPFFGTGTYDMAAAVLVFISNMLFSTILAYYVLKMTDMQRQILEQMRVISRLAYLEGRSLMRPSEYLNQRFNFDEPLNPHDVFRGVAGWCVVRSLVFYASTCSNHAARSSAMSVYLAFALFGFLATILDIVYILVAGYLHSGMHFSTGHSYAIVLCTLWGLMLLRYLYICVETVKEHKVHLYLLDVASLYHRMRQGPGGEGSEVIARCREMIKEHEELPSVFSVQISPHILAAMAFIHVLALAVIVLNIYIAIHNRQSHRM